MKINITEVNKLKNLSFASTSTDQQSSKVHLSVVNGKIHASVVNQSGLFVLKMDLIDGDSDEVMVVDLPTLVKLLQTFKSDTVDLVVDSDDPSNILVLSEKGSYPIENYRLTSAGRTIEDTIEAMDRLTTTGKTQRVSSLADAQELIAFCPNKSSSIQSSALVASRHGQSTTDRNRIIYLSDDEATEGTEVYLSQDVVKVLAGEYDSVIFEELSQEVSDDVESGDSIWAMRDENYSIYFKSKADPYTELTIKEEALSKFGRREMPMIEASSEDILSFLSRAHIILKEADPDARKVLLTVKGQTMQMSLPNKKAKETVDIVNESGSDFSGLVIVDNILPVIKLFSKSGVVHFNSYNDSTDLLQFQGGNFVLTMRLESAVVVANA
jgi:hypothetical protein